MKNHTDELIARGMAALKELEKIPPAERFDRMVAAGIITADGKLCHVDGPDEEVPISQLIREVVPPKDLLGELSAEAFLKILDLVEHPPAPSRSLKDAMTRYRKMAEVAANYTKEDLAELTELDRKAQSGELIGQGTSLEAMLLLRCLMARDSAETGPREEVPARAAEQTAAALLDNVAGTGGVALDTGIASSSPIASDHDRATIDRAKYGWWVRERVISDPAVLGGSPVFAGSRLSVEHVGGAAVRGEAGVAEMLADYPYLTRTDVLCAGWWLQARRLAEAVEGLSIAAIEDDLDSRPVEVDHDRLARLLRSGRAGAPKGAQSHATVDHERLRAIFASHKPDPGFADAIELASGESGAQAAALAILSGLTNEQFDALTASLAEAQVEDAEVVRRHLALARRMVGEAVK